MNVPTLELQRITLRPFHETDMEIIKSLLNDPLATSNLPWVSAPSHLNAENFYTRLIANSPYFFIIEINPAVPCSTRSSEPLNPNRK